MTSPRATLVLSALALAVGTLFYLSDDGKVHLREGV